MTDDKSEEQQTDLAKEIEELDEFLEEQEMDFPLEDDDSDFGQPVFSGGTPAQIEEKQKRKASSGKLIGYLILLGVLFGGAYAAFVYAPQFIEKPGFEKVQKFVSNESGGLVDSLSETFKSYVPTKETKKDAQASQQPSTQTANNVDGDELPLPSDSELTDLNDISEIDSMSIEEALNFIEEPAATEEVVNQAEDTSSVENANIDQVPSSPNVPDLPPIDEEKIETAQEIAEMPAEELIEIVEEEETVTADEVVEIAEEKAEEEEMVPSAPKVEIEAVEIETKKATPVRVEKPAVKKAAPKPEDPRVAQARAMFENGDYNRALNLYDAVLAADPANTSALTGRQLAQAKLRMTGVQKPVAIQQQQPAPRMPSAPVAPVTQSAPVTSNSGELATLLQRAQANPRDAILAFKIGNAYKNSNKASAMEWYRKALQIDVMYGSALDRMAVYDAMAGLQ